MDGGLRRRNDRYGRKRTGMDREGRAWTGNGIGRVWTGKDGKGRYRRERTDMDRERRGSLGRKDNKGRIWTARHGWLRVGMNRKGQVFTGKDGYGPERRGLRVEGQFGQGSRIVIEGRYGLGIKE